MKRIADRTESPASQARPEEQRPVVRDQGSTHRIPLSLVTVVLMLVLWEGLSVLLGTNSFHEDTLPSPQDLGSALKSLAYYWRGGLGVAATNTGGSVTWQGALLSLCYNSLETIFRAMAGFVVGIVAGLGLAIALSWSDVLRQMFGGPGHFSRTLPLLAIVPLFDLWFGNGELGAILFVALATFMLVFVVALESIEGVPAYYKAYARTQGASPARVYLGVVVPAAVPHMKGGVLLAFGFSWSAAIAAEFMGEQYGLGAIVVLAEEYGRYYTLMLIGIVAVFIAAIGYALMNRAFSWITRWAD